MSDDQLYNSFQSDHAVQPSLSVQMQNLNINNDKASVNEQTLGSSSIKPALKKTMPFDSLNLGTGFLVRNQESYGNRGSNRLAIIHPAQCSRCLCGGHSSKYCSFPVRCLVCFNYGHRAKFCLLQPKCQMIWMPKQMVQIENESGPKIKWKPKKPIDQQPRSEQVTNMVSDPPASRKVQEPSASTPQSPSPLLNSLHSGVVEEPPSDTRNDQAPPPPHQPDRMANFACDPSPFIPFGAHVENGWQRPARSRVAIGGEPPRRHEEYAIVTLDPPPPPQHARVTLTDVVNLLQDNFPVRIVSHYLSPLGLGLVEFGTAIQRQSMLDISPIDVNENSVLHVVKHDEAINLRSCPYTRDCWIMFLAFPLDYQLEGFMHAAVAPFGRMLFWRPSRNKSVCLLHCLLIDPSRVPRSVVVSQGTPIGGNGRSWSVPTYILGGNIVIQPGDEDPIPADGNPHPAQGPPLAGNPNNFQNWLHDHAGAAAQVLADAGINDQLMQDINEEIQVQQNQNFVQENGEMEQNEAVVVDWVPQHPE